MRKAVARKTGIISGGAEQRNVPQGLLSGEAPRHCEHTVELRRAFREGAEQRNSSLDSSKLRGAILKLS